MGHRMAKGASHHIHPLAMPVTWQSGRVHVAYLPPPKETGEGGLVRVKVRGGGIREMPGKHSSQDQDVDKAKQ